MTKITKKNLNQKLRKQRIRAKISGTTERPRLSVSISNLHITAQIIDDSQQKTLAYSTTVGKKLAGSMTEKAITVGTEIGKKASKAKIKQVAFDRNGRQYAGRLQALAEAARKEGVEF